MALGDDYITAEQLKDYMGAKVTSGFDEVLQDSVSAVTDEIIRHCHRDFNDAGEVSSRQYPVIRHPDYGSMIITDDFHSVDGLVAGDLTFADLRLEPLNGIVQGMTGWPYWRIIGSFTPGELVSVTAQWGWAEIPGAVRQAAFIWAADTFQLKDQRLGLAGSDQFGSVISVRDCKPAKLKLKGYRRDSVLVDG